MMEDNYKEKDMNQKDMNQKITKIIFFFLIVFIPWLPGCSFASQTGTISVGIAIGVNKASFSAVKSSLTMTGASGKKMTFRSPVQVLSGASGTVSAGTAKLKLPVIIKSTGIILWNNRPYRGYLRLSAEGQGFNVINVIPLEDYLKGVLKMEVNPAWPVESLKAQAIIARTYALRSRNKHGSSGFDLCSTNHCQVYRGVNAEDPILSKAIDSTKGMVLKYQGSLAATFYHADSGGHTADVASVWSSNIPYLKGKPEPINYESPYSHWQVNLSLTEIQRALSSRGINLGKLRGVNISSTDSAGRAEMITLIGTGGQTTIKASQFRTFMGSDRIRSTFFAIGGQSVSPSTRNVSVPTAPSSLDDLIPLTPQDELLLISLTQEGVFNSEELMDMLVKPERRGFYLKKALERQSGCDVPSVSATASFNLPTGEILSFTGKGWGHGVGLSQWGAKSLSEAGWDHRKILQHYFPGTSLQKISY